MIFVAHDGRYHVCYTVAPDGRSRRYLGCRHETPRQAIAHTVPVYTSPTRSESPSYPPTVSVSATGAAGAGYWASGGGLSEEPDPFVDRPSLTTGALTGSSRAPLVPDIEPGRAGALSLGI